MAGREMRDRIARLAQSSLMHVFGAFIIMGGWGFFANSDHAMPAPIIAGLVQGGLSAVITLLLKRTVEFLGRNLPAFSALVLPPLVASMLSFFLLFSIHQLIDTPQVLLTIALPFTMATFYAVIYNHSLWLMRRNANE